MIQKIWISLIIIVWIMTTLSEAQVSYYDTKERKYINIVQVGEKMKQAQYVAIGEQHDHKEGHAQEEVLLKVYYNETKTTQRKLALAMEMVERDCQSILSGYLADDVTEAFYMANSRPWPNYPTDYKPLVEFCKYQQLDVIAANIPRRYAAFVAKGKEQEVFNMPDQELSYMAPAPIQAPKDTGYYTKFYDLMKKNGMDDATIERYYRSQCAKDDTMAMSISNALANDASLNILSVSGAFHVESYLGLYRKVKSAKKMLINIIPYDSKNPIDPSAYLSTADVLVFAPANPSSF